MDFENDEKDMNGHVKIGNDDTEKLYTTWYNQDITQEWILKSDAYHISHFSSFYQRFLILNHPLIVKGKHISSLFFLEILLFILSLLQNFYPP